MFRWIVKAIRDECAIPEEQLTGVARLETESGLSVEQLEELLAMIEASFQCRFCPGTLDEVLELKERCVLSSWLTGLYKRPEFISDAFDATCRASNPGMA